MDVAKLTLKNYMLVIAVNYISNRKKLWQQ